MTPIQMTYAHLFRENGDGKEVLLPRRISKKIAHGIRSGPGGEFDRKDKGSARRCIWRECNEELDLDIDLGSTVYMATARYWHGGVLTRIVHFFNVYKWKREPRPAQGFEELEWFNLKKLPLNEMFLDLQLWIKMALLLPEDGSQVLRVDVFYEDKGLDKIYDIRSKRVDRKEGFLREDI